MTDILNRLDAANEYCETSEARQLRKDAADEIRRLNGALWDAKREIDGLKTAMLRNNSKKMARAS